MTGAKALLRDRFWAHQQRKILEGGNVFFEEIDKVAKFFEFKINNREDLKKHLPDIAAYQTMVRSATGIANNEKIFSDLRFGEWINNFNNIEYEITYQINAKREVSKIVAFDIFIGSGEQEFEFGESLTEEFRHTDVEDILWSEINYPYGAFYMRFEGLQGRTLEDRDLDGFLLLKTSDALVIYPISKEPMPAWGLLSEHGRIAHTNMQIFCKSEEDSPIMDATGKIMETLDKEISLFTTKPDNLDQEAYEMFCSNNRQAKELVGKQAKDWVRLIVNGLLTIDAGGIEPIVSYPYGAPLDLAEKALSDRPGARKADQRLRAEGYVRLKRYEVPQQGESASASGKSIAPHWRRGHWRKQHYGPAKSLIKRIRIAPTIINAGKGDLAPRKGYKI